MAAVRILVLLFAALCVATTESYFMDSPYCKFTQAQINAYKTCFKSVLNKPANAENAKNLTPQQRYDLSYCVDVKLGVVTGSTYNLAQALAEIDQYATNPKTKLALKTAEKQCAANHKDVKSFVLCDDEVFNKYCYPKTH